ncbi:hypothetical protein [Streptosporangium roseum]|uniref:Glycoside hydrolase family 2 sugar binding protein n=1 Tax=Streptosporangium roseum (strain ATCC 12428 / DSM 43021 / JCM 3005 / KCTC 9067 / NCIMB 10171 / NRRL 2505 / NI 9100) TaxID=479432 RepID=D2AYU5_STRRD|nr:hypothetical protein [Streptosporangium roseum]ACZ90882.1 hypothetical protein Sros_8233 [Streptosporangium roseum DSM 43021]
MNVFDALRNPPRSHSPAAIWWWSGEPLRRERLRWQMERLVAGGVHNLVILNLAPSGPLFGADADDPPFLSEAWWELLDGVCEDALQTGAYLWFYDQLGFSGADLQARLVQENPAFAGQWLDADGSVSLRGFDYLSRTACEVLLDRVHGEFARRLGHRFGNVIVGSFQDELPSMPTWSATFAEEFLARRGYPFSRDGGPSVRHDYQRTRAELAEEAFFRPLAEWHAEHGLLNGCDQQDPARAGHPVEGVELYADYTRTHRWFSAPGSDHHGDARVHSSLAHLYGRPRTWIEAFHSSGWGGTLEETFDWLLPWLRAGANLYNPHAVYYTTRAGWWEWAPPSTDWRQPYWRHHRVFADAVTRLCAVLSLGRHLCDVAVLFPAATAQAGGAGDGDAARAQRVYRELVGDMAWFQTVPGALDRLCLDADVIDEESVRRAVVSDGRLAVSTESYGVVILPAATVLDEGTAERLDGFVADGGLLVAVGALPDSPRLRRHFEGGPEGGPTAGPGEGPAGGSGRGSGAGRGRGAARLVASAADLGEALAGHVPRVEAPVPPLVREVDGTTVVFLTAAFPRASEIGVGRPEERGVELGWLDATCDFDSGRYRREMRVRVRDVTGTPLLASPFSGEVRPLPYTLDDGVVEVTVPFEDGPAALLLFPGQGTVPETGETAAPESRTPYTREIDLGDEWDMELVPTLDDTWGDFGTSATVERWTLETPDGDPVHATFGPHGLWRTGDGDWRPAVWSTSRGLHKDPIHRDTLGPKGHVPEEFLDFGPVPAGRPVWFRASVTVPGTPEARLVVGAAAAKEVRVDGRELPLDDSGYLAVGLSPVEPGEHVLELRLVPDEDLTLRAHVSFTADPGAARRPEWIAGPVLETVVRAGEGGEDGEHVLQIASTSPCMVLVNGTEAGRQGGFDPYAEADIPRVRRYDVSHLLRPGPNTVRVESDGAVLADGLVVSGPGWTSRPGVRRRQHGDPAALHLRPRPHPLPGAGWIDSRATALPAIFAVPGAAERVERFRVDVPPGATLMEADAHGPVRVLVDGVESALPAVLDGSARRAELLVTTRPGFQGGAALAGPVRFACGPGRIKLGDWEAQGLAGYSGGVRYRTVVRLPASPAGRPGLAGPGPAGERGRAELDLGRVRGTAEVTVNGRPAGVRVCWPYVFDLSLDEGENTVEILVLGTLAPYLDAVSPTHFVFPGQRVTGLFGPVLLRT